MLKSWIARPFHSDSAATASAPNVANTAPRTLAARSGRPRHRPEKPSTTAQAESSSASQRQNSPSRVIGLCLFPFGGGLGAGAALGQHLGGPEDAVPAEAAVYDHFDVVGVGEGIGHEPAVGHWIGADPVAHLEVDLAVAGIATDGAGHDLSAHLEADVIEGRVGRGL